MFIAGLQKVSLLDYPHQVSCVIFTQGCNFACPFCHNPELNPEIGIDTKSHSLISEKRVLNYLEKRKKLLDGVVITGGEPLLQKDLKDFLEKIHSLKLKIKIDTNGSFFKELRELITEGLVDYIAMDIKTSLKKYRFLGCRDVAPIRASIDLLFREKVDYEFRTTVVPRLVEEEDIREIGELARGGKRLYLQQFRREKTLDTQYGKVTPYPQTTLSRFKKILENFIKEVEIRE